MAKVDIVLKAFIIIKPIIASFRESKFRRATIFHQHGNLCASASVTRKSTSRQSFHLDPGDNHESLIRTVAHNCYRSSLKDVITFPYAIVLCILCCGYRVLDWFRSSWMLGILRQVLVFLIIPKCAKYILLTFFASHCLLIPHRSNVSHSGDLTYQAHVYRILNEIM